MTAEEMMERTHLSDLVRTTMEKNGQSYRTLAATSIDPEDPGAGPQWTRSTIDSLTKGRRIKAPTDAQLRALADALRIPPQVVVQAAAAQWLGMTEQWNADHNTRILIARIEELEPEEVDEVGELAEFVFRRRSRRSSGQG